MGITVGLVLLMVAVVAGAVIWKKRSGREGREDLSFRVSLGVSSPGRRLPTWLLESTLQTCMEYGADANILLF